MEMITIPVAILSFFLRIGCDASKIEAYYVDAIKVPEWTDTVVLGISCPTVAQPHCPKAPAIYVRRDVKDTGVLVHEIAHACFDVPAQRGTSQHKVNEARARNVEMYWRTDH